MKTLRERAMQIVRDYHVKKCIFPFKFQGVYYGVTCNKGIIKIYFMLNARSDRYAVKVDEFTV